MNVRKRSLAFMALLALLLVPYAAAVQRCLANPAVTVNLSQSSGPIGVTVTVSGQLENPGAEFKVFWQYIRDWNGRYGLLASGYAEGYNYAVNITIPPAAAGGHYVIVEDEKNHVTGYAVFTVTPEIAVQPDTAPSGAVVTVSGRLINGETIDIKFYDPVAGDEQLVAQAVTDAATGEFSRSFKVPLKPEGDYEVRAYWSGVLQAEASFHIGYQGMDVKPDRAPPNAIVNVSGGLAINVSLIIAFANSTWSVDVATVQTDQSGQFSVNVTVPEADPGDYYVKALNPVGRSEVASAPFTILPPAQVTAFSDAAIPSEALAGFSVITVEGQNFIADEKVIIYFESSPVQVAETTTDSNGEFTAQFTVPGDATAGVHTIYAVQDPYNVSANTTITIYTVEIKPYSQIYVPGDTICFSVNSSTPFAVPSEIVINVFDPNGVPYTPNGYHVNAGNDIVQVKGFYVAPYDRIAFWPDIPKGAPAGIWTWNATYYLALYPGVQFNASGFFLVIPEPDLYYILQRLNEIDAKIEGIAYQQDQLYVLIQAHHNYVMARLDQLEANLASITTSGFAQINTVLGEVKVKLDVLDVKITEVEDNVAIIQTSLGTLTADVATIRNALLQMNAEIAYIKDGVATIQTDAGVIKAKLDALSATVLSVENGVAQLNTAIGTLAVDVAMIKDMLSQANAEITAIKDGIATIQTDSGVIKAELGNINAVLTSINGSVANVATEIGEVKVQVKELKELFANSTANIISLIADAEGAILAKIEAGNAEIIARLDALNATVASVKDGVATVNTELGELKADLATLGANVTQLIVDSEGRIAVQMQTLLGPVNATLEELGGKVTAINGNVANVLISGLGEVKASVVEAKNASEGAAQTASAMNTLMYIVVALSLVAAAVSAVNFIHLRRKEASS